MQNSMKHAGGVKGISVSLAAPGDLRFEVRDDGAGFALDEVASGAGITNMRDRLAAVGGILVIGSTPGKGTIVSGTVSLNGNGAGEATTIGRLATRAPTPLAGSR
jgi:signal transduction histidine kinase